MKKLQKYEALINKMKEVNMKLLFMPLNQSSN